MTSERARQVWGGAPGAPPIYLGSRAKFSQKIMFPWKVGSIPTHLVPFWKIFSKITKKMGENWKSIKKWLNMSEISKFCNFWAISTCNTSKESIFHIEFNFKQKKYDLFEEKLKKKQIFIFFFFENRCWPVVFNCKFLIFVQRDLKTEFICALEMFWN